MKDLYLWPRYVKIFPFGLHSTWPAFGEVHDHVHRGKPHLTTAATVGYFDSCYWQMSTGTGPQKKGFSTQLHVVSPKVSLMNKMNVILQRSMWYFTNDVLFVLSSLCLTTSLNCCMCHGFKSFGEMVIPPLTRNPVGGRISAKVADWSATLGKSCSMQARLGTPHPPSRFGLGLGDSRNGLVEKGEGSVWVKEW